MHAKQTRGRRGSGCAEVFGSLELLELLLHGLVDFKRRRGLAILQECPKLLETIEVS